MMLGVAASLAYAWFKSPTAEMASMGLDEENVAASLVEYMESVGMTDEEIAEALEDIMSEMEDGK